MGKNVLDPETLDPGLRHRSRGRELAMKLLYMIDIFDEEGVQGSLRVLLAEEEVSRESQDFALKLYRGAKERFDELDAKISEKAENWELSRMAYIDRSLLRLGAYELLFVEDIPPKVTIFEALELAKKYSTEKSASFINGILDQLYQNYCPDKNQGKSA